jgi:hypothetical protein
MELIFIGLVRKAWLRMAPQLQVSLFYVPSIVFPFALSLNALILVCLVLTARSHSDDTFWSCRLRQRRQVWFPEDRGQGNRYNW